MDDSHITEPWARIVTITMPKTTLRDRFGFQNLVQDGGTATITAHHKLWQQWLIPEPAENSIKIW